MALPKPRVTTTKGLSGFPRCHQCGRRSPLLVEVSARKLCPDCHPRINDVVRVVDES